MPNLNSVQIIGNVTRDIDLKYTPKGTAVAELGIAVNREWKDENGQKREEATFIDCELWGRTAELAGEYLKKGSSVFISGRLKVDSWDDKATGQKRTKLKVVGENLQFLGSRGDSGGGERQERQERPQRSSAAPPARKPDQPMTDQELEDSDAIPF